MASASLSARRISSAHHFGPIPSAAPNVRDRRQRRQMCGTYWRHGSAIGATRKRRLQPRQALCHRRTRPDCDPRLDDPAGDRRAPAPPPSRWRSQDISAAPAFRNPPCPATSGTRTADSNSPALKSVCRTPVRNRSNGSTRTPFRETNSTDASSVNSGGTPSAAGEALQRFPAIVPAFWIWTEPTSRAAAFSPSKDAGNAARTRSLQRVAAPIRQPSGPRVIPRNPGNRVTSSIASPVIRSPARRKPVGPACDGRGAVARHRLEGGLQCFGRVVGHRGLACQNCSYTNKRRLGESCQILSRTTPRRAPPAPACPAHA